MVRGRRMLTSVALIGTGVLVAATLWAFAWEPILHRVYGDVPRLEFRTDLDKPLEFRARILDKRNYWLDLLVYYDNKDQRAAVEQIVGRYRGSEKTPADYGVPTQFHVVVRDESRRIIRDEIRTAVGMNGFTAHYRVRRIDEFILSPGIYFIQATPVGDFSAFRGFRTAFELTSNPKATPIRD
jgi:hypothetical protein